MKKSFFIFFYKKYKCVCFIVHYTGLTLSMEQHCLNLCTRFKWPKLIVVEKAGSVCLYLDHKKQTCCPTQTTYGFMYRTKSDVVHITEVYLVRDSLVQDNDNIRFS